MPGHTTGIGVVNLDGQQRSNLRNLDVEEVDVMR